MEIIVQGNGKLLLEPNQITIKFENRSKNKSADIATEIGVSTFKKLSKLLEDVGFNPNDLRTTDCKLNENQVYDETKRKYVKDCYEFYQSAKITFDLDMTRLSIIREQLLTLGEDSPTYSITFERNDTDNVIEEILKQAFADAEFQAKSIASAAGQQLLECTKVSFEPFDNRTFYSDTELGVNCMMAKSRSAATDFAQTIIPDKITVTKTIYCNFAAK